MKIKVINRDWTSWDGKEHRDHNITVGKEYEVVGKSVGELPEIIDDEGDNFALTHEQYEKLEEEAK